MKIVLAPDKFKGTLTAPQACQAMMRGIHAVDSTIEVVCCPVADGGEGTLDAIASSTHARQDIHDVSGPLPGMKVKAPIVYLPDGTAYIELAAASGLQLLSPDQYNPMRTTTFGTGELLRIAANRHYKKIVLGIGGSATCDAGIGMIQAWGAAIKTINGKVYSPQDRKLCGDDLGRILSIQKYQPTFNIDNFAMQPRKAGWNARDPLLDIGNIQFTVACDVGNPLFGPNGAAHIFAPQKGATPDMCDELDANLRKFADRLQLKSIAEEPGAGAAGGVGFAMLAFFGAEVVSGADMVIKLVKLTDHLKNADLCITGEGKMDIQTLAGKSPFAVAQTCKANNIPCIAITGTTGAGAEQMLNEGITSIFTITNNTISPQEAIKHAPNLLEQTTRNAIFSYLGK